MEKNCYGTILKVKERFSIISSAVTRFMFFEDEKSMNEQEEK